MSGFPNISQLGEALRSALTNARAHNVACYVQQPWDVHAFVCVYGLYSNYNRQWNDVTNLEK